MTAEVKPETVEVIDNTEHFEQSPAAVDKIDRAAGVLRGVRVMGIRSAHGYDYSLDAQRAAVGRYEQMPVGLDHDYDGGPLRVEAAWGTLSNARVDDRGTIADLTYLRSHARTEQVLEDVERSVGLFSLSAVTTRVIENPKGTVKSFAPVRVDLVVRGATTKRLFEQSKKDDERLAALEQRLAASEAKLAASEARQAKYEQYIAPQAGVAATIEKVVVESAIDLKKFWND